jgi:hypothetical protein
MEGKKMAEAAKATPAKAAKAVKPDPSLDDEPNVMDVPGHWKQLDDTGKVAWVRGSSTAICDHTDHTAHEIHPTTSGWWCEHTGAIKFRQPAQPDGSKIVQTESVGDKKRRLAELQAEIEAQEAVEAAAGESE